MWKLNLGYGSCIGSFVFLFERGLKECLGRDGGARIQISFFLKNEVFS
jgi:hypothetical protein